MQEQVYQYLYKLIQFQLEQVVLEEMVLDLLLEEVETIVFLAQSLQQVVVEVE
tara:strand:- start:348 stop:506 length:159 start_codon:yes stop_codon:yes gene_type:complete